MGALAILVFLLLLAKGVEAAPAAPAVAPTPTPPAPKPPAKPPAAPSPAPAMPAAPQYPEPLKPWPVAAPAAPAPAVPVGLPKFPSGWEPDVPPSSAVVQRANALLPELWRSGKAGAIKQEVTAGRWTTYQAYSPAKGKRGVVAYRPKGGGGTVYA